MILRMRVLLMHIIMRIWGVIMTMAGMMKMIMVAVMPATNVLMMIMRWKLGSMRL